MPLKIEIKGIKDGEVIPTEFTCEGKNYSPEVSFRDVPSGTKSLALIVEDPDAPVGLFVHWVIYNIDPNVSKIRYSVEKVAKTKEGFIQGKNDFGKVGYDGPCPPKGHGFHRYYFKVYALNSVLAVQGNATREVLLNSMEDKILGQTECMGKYRR
jgi:Raf kinase inhibitor-like YbhB/YbcL family protein